MVDIREKTGELVVVRDAGLWLIGMYGESGKPVRNAENSLTIGHTTTGHPHLSPVFELSVGIERGPNGGQAIRYGAVPCLLLEDIARYELGPDAHVWPIKGMSVEDHLRHAYQSGLEASAGLKASRGRITIAMPGDVPPLPTNGGRK